MFALADRLERRELRRRCARLPGLLAGLARREWLTIRRDRHESRLPEIIYARGAASASGAGATDRKYRRNARSLRQFDRVWYGLHVPTPEAVASYRQDQRELLNHV